MPRTKQFKGLHQISPFLSISGFIKPFFVWNLMASRNLLSGFMFDFQAYQWDDSNWRADISDGYQDYPITHNFKRELQNITDKIYPNLKKVTSYYNMSQLKSSWTTSKALAPRVELPPSWRGGSVSYWAWRWASALGATVPGESPQKDWKKVEFTTI